MAECAENCSDRFFVWAESRSDKLSEWAESLSVSAEPRVSSVEAIASSGLYALTRQDVAANKSVQRGMQSRFAPRGRLSWQEEPINYFNKWLVKRYQQYMAEAI